MTNWLLKRNDIGQMLSLHEQYVWTDELSWSDVARGEPTRMLSGGIDIQEGLMLAGRPITLKGANATIKRGKLKTLQAWTNVPEIEMTLTHPDGRVFAVTFSKNPISNEKGLFKDYRPSDQSDDDKMQADISLITI